MWCVRATRALAMLWAVALLQGCAALTNPVADGIPVNRLPPEVFGEPRADLVPIELTYLRQKPPEVYRIDKEDVLGIVIEGILGERNTPPPVRLSDLGNFPPAIGYPVPVQADGTILLPLVDPIEVKGLTLTEIRQKIKEVYTDPARELLQKGKERIIVTLLQPRRYHVLVVREDGGSLNAVGGFQSFTGTNVLGTSRRGSGVALDLPAYENDVANALTRTGGLPGLDAKNEVVVQRGGVTARLTEGTSPDANADTRQGAIIRIPLRRRPNDPINIKEEDVILNTGDIVYIESREAEVFYTGGLLGSGQFPLPRDVDLTVTQAVAQVRGPLINGGFTQNLFVPNAVGSGIGNPSPSLLSVIRRLNNGQQINIRVDLNKAFRDPRENILVKPGDFLVLQEKAEEGFARYMTQALRFNIFGFMIRRQDLTFTGNGNFP